MLILLIVVMAILSVVVMAILLIVVMAIPRTSEPSSVPPMAPQRFRAVHRRLGDGWLAVEAPNPHRRFEGRGCPLLASDKVFA